jgi:hypothetical protein
LPKVAAEAEAGTPRQDRIQNDQIEAVAGGFDKAALAIGRQF